MTEPARAVIPREHLDRHYRLLDGLIEGFNSFRADGPDFRVAPEQDVIRSGEIRVPDGADLPTR